MFAFRVMPRATGRGSVECRARLCEPFRGPARFPVRRFESSPEELNHVVATFLTLPITLFFVGATSVLGQGLDTTAQKDDWEEINFEFDSDVLTDGYPSLLRLAELLNQNTDYKVALNGHTDFRGSDQYNDGLGRRRAETVRAFLLKYGARDSQISVVSRGEGVPKVSNETDEGRWMNRRVTMDVTDGEGRRIADGGVREAIESIEKAGMSEDCCNEILDRLSKLDEILDLLKDLKDENEALKGDVEELKAKAAEPPQYPEPPSPAEVASAVRQEVEDYERTKPQNKYATFNVNAGPSSDSGNLSVTGQGRVFVPFAKRHAIQSQGEYLHYFGRDEGQVDLGLVSRYGDVQIGGFSSFKYVKFNEWDRVGGLGQAAFTLDYVFDRGRVGRLRHQGLPRRRRRQHGPAAAQRDRGNLPQRGRPGRLLGRGRRLGTVVV